MYCMHAKGASEAYFRGYKISNFLGVHPQTPRTKSIVWAPLLYLPWAPTIFSAAQDPELAKVKDVCELALFPGSPDPMMQMEQDSLVM